MQRQIHVLLEEPSAKATLEHVLPRLLPPDIHHRCITFQGKPDLLQQLPNRLRGYRKRLDHERLRVVVLIDRDTQDCLVLKRRLEAMAREAGLTTRSSRGPDGEYVVLNRIAVEELEAWFLGDETALRAAYPRLKKGVTRAQSIRCPDDVKGGTAEALHRVFKRAGYFKDSHMPKTDVARKVGEHLSVTPNDNRSPSFQVFLAGLTDLVQRFSEEPPP
ncbi:DUF4276 family protein [Roseospira navarrensis]|uniref:DUF4276 family protein n=1 Tax=Roseospira navarrensis TaxID=140058 RepID=A0A7X2D3I3_9PROT|nr:DUF4276 family protein [Roseospira navarrensis]MQX35647.1 DUF4276 family protein [Roseospira navarrensis]